MSTLKRKIISHRANLEGPNKELENSPKQIDKAIMHGYDVEVDVWYFKKDDSYYLGHDSPDHKIECEFLVNRKDKLWCHAKNIECLERMVLLDLNCFWHQSDDVVLTYSGHLWTYPGKELTKNSICVMPELIQDFDFKNLPDCLGFCTDYPKLIKL